MNKQFLYSEAVSQTQKEFYLWHYVEKKEPKSLSAWMMYRQSF